LSGGEITGLLETNHDQNQDARLTFLLFFYHPLALTRFFCYSFFMTKARSTHKTLLNQAISLTHRPPEETMDMALRFFIAATRSPATSLRDYRGKIDLGIAIDDLREDRP
jgi:hypothetical protein